MGSSGALVSILVSSEPVSFISTSVIFSLIMVEPSKSSKHAHFNEDELNDYDKTRGQKQKIDEPKTPYNDEEPEELADHEMTNEQEDIDVIVEQHLEEARKNREKNAQLMEAALK